MRVPLDHDWCGGHYEIAVEYLDQQDAQLESALAAVRAEPTLDGWYQTSQSDSASQPRVELSLSAVMGSRLFAMARTPSGDQIPCMCCIVREEGGSDWLYLALPLSALHMTNPDIGGFPFGDTVNCRSWREPLDQWLTEIGMRIFEAAPFQLGLVGFEVLVECDDVTSRVPEERNARYLSPQAGSIEVFPPTHWT